jgi:protein-tyrosine phosphatase
MKIRVEGESYFQRKWGIKMIDLHSHILPGFDDGAKNEPNALAMLKLAATAGTKTIVATPHVVEGGWLPAWEDIVAGCKHLAEIAAKSGIDIEIIPGAEIAFDFEILDLLKSPGTYCINGGKYILIELPTGHIPQCADEFFFKLQARGFLPIIAHPERNIELARKPDILRGWIEKGILVQLNGSSITGKMGERVKKFAEKLLLRDMVHCLGSDAHGVNQRRPDLTAAVKKISDMVGLDMTKRLVKVNPGKIVKNEEFSVPRPRERSPEKDGTVQRILRKIITI